MTDKFTHDAFLGGRLHLWQPRGGYRAGIDPVLLAACVPAKAGETVLDLGCGAGAAALCLHTRVTGVHLIGVERQSEYAALARKNAEESKAGMEVFQADISDLPAELRQRQVHHVIANPPYYTAQSRSAADDKGREAALSEDTPLAQWVAVAARRLSPRGMLHMIQRVDRLPDVLNAVQNRLGSVEVLPFAGRSGRPARLFVLRARKGGRAAFQLHAPVILHEGAQHERDGDSYRPEITAVLRDAAPMPWPNAAQN